ENDARTHSRDSADARMVHTGAVQVGSETISECGKFLVGGFWGERTGVVCATREEGNLVAGPEQVDRAGICTDWDWDATGDGDAGERNSPRLLGERLKWDAWGQFTGRRRRRIFVFGLIWMGAGNRRLRQGFVSLITCSIWWRGMARLI